MHTKTGNQLKMPTQMVFYHILEMNMDVKPFMDNVIGLT